MRITATNNDPTSSKYSLTGSDNFDDFNAPLYHSLTDVLRGAYRQAASGKGKDRHATANEAFEDQQICEITKRLMGHPCAGALFQAVKKIYESGRLAQYDYRAAIKELYGAINYTSAAIVVLKELATQAEGRINRHNGPPLH